MPFIQKEINELKIARLLIIWPGDLEKSWFKGIKHLMPSHTLRVTREKTELRRYWDYTDIREREGLTLEDYTEDLLENLKQAVNVRLRSYTPVAATLSGGLDSGTVCVLAAEQLAKRQTRLRTYSHVPRFQLNEAVPVHKFGDERPYIEATVKASGTIDPVYLTSAGISPLEGMREALRLYGQPFHAAANAYWLADLHQTAASDGIGVLLNGVFGNATISWKGVEDTLPTGELIRRIGLKSTAKRKLIMPVLRGHTPLAPAWTRLKRGARP